jgi:isochorismate hydrolase
MQRLEPTTTAVVAVDIQEALARVMPPAQFEQLLRSARILLTGARLLKCPVLATEQYPKGLGPTVAEVEQLLQGSGAHRFEKLEFSACNASGFGTALEQARARAVVVIGMETHVCVFQTVRDLVARGLETYVLIDGVASRREDHRETGLRLCERAGAVCTTTESVVFDWLCRAGSDEFRELSRLMR